MQPKTDVQLNRLLYRWSPYKLTSFLTCKLKGACEYWLGLRSEVPQNAYQVFGSVLHQVFAQHFRNKAGYKDLKSIRGAFTHRWLTALDTKEDLPILFRSEDPTPAQFLGMGHAILKPFFEDSMPYIDGTLPRPKVEVRIDGKIGNLKITGIIDRLEQAQNPQDWKIIDYKTGALTYSEAEIARNLQFITYAWLFLTNIGFQPQKEVWYFRKNKESSLWEILKQPLPLYTEDDFAWLMCLLEDMVRYLRNVLGLDGQLTCILAKNNKHYFCRGDILLGIFTREPGRHCRFCEYETVCKSFSPENFKQNIKTKLAQITKIHLPAEQLCLDLGKMRTAREQRNLSGELLIKKGKTIK